MKSQTKSVLRHDDWAMAYVLDAFNGDLKMIEQALRADSVFSSRNGLSNKMKKSESLKSMVSRKENEIIRQVRNLLLSVFCGMFSKYFNSGIILHW